MDIVIFAYTISSPIIFDLRMTYQTFKMDFKILMFTE